jgi:hypothetical protein
VRDSTPSGDHAVPVTLITRSQPKVRGFDYAGKIQTHETCNNRFGPEAYATKALDLLEVLADQKNYLTLQSRQHPEITILALDASKLPSMTQKDLQFFKMIDVRDSDVNSLKDPSFYRGKQKTNPTRDALYVALSVLTKSAAALLIKRKIHSVPKSWKVYAIPYSGASDQLDFDDFVGETQPFDDAIKAWIRQLDEYQDWLVLYRAKSLLVYLIFVFEDHDPLPFLKQKFSESDIQLFSGAAINDMLTKGWHKV